MQYTIIPAENFSPRKWSGGTTTQLFIFPSDADYAQQNFLFRLSSATVETEKSEFTKLPGISRKIMILKGATTLFHEGHYSKLLEKFDTDEFEGDWNTRSEGQCTDFNLMTKGASKGSLKGLALDKGQKESLQVQMPCDYCFIYVFSGQVSLMLKERNVHLSQGSLLVLQEATAIDLEASENSELVFVALCL